MSRTSNGSSEREQHYRRLLAEHARSGTSLRAFAERRGLVHSTLAWWKHVLARKAPKNGASVEAPLLPVQVVSKRSEARGADFIVKLRSGHRVHVPHGFDARELHALVTILAAC